MSGIKEKRVKIRAVDFDQFMFRYSPDKLESRIHDHEKHRDAVQKISELEKNVLYFLSDRCSCMINETPTAKHESYTYDENLMSLYYSIHRFMETGSREDAFDVYFCFINIIEISDYNLAKKLIEMLSNYETNASNLVLKHRDHYSHSVYVFLTGLSIYHNNENYRDTYKKTYFDGKRPDYETDSDEETVALNFLKFWGITSLFHDIGYPFEIPFEQIKTYFSIDNKGDKVEYKTLPFIAYKNLDDFISLKKTIKEFDRPKLSDAEYILLAKAFLEDNDADNDEQTIADVLAHHIARRLSERNLTEKGINEILLTKPTDPSKYNYFMDHALFSGIVFFRKLISIFGTDTILPDGEDGYLWMDAMTAIVMHNSLFKFALRKYTDDSGNSIKRALDMNEHPLAYMLMLCDELQCWDRTSYGRDSKKQLHASNCEFIYKQDGTVCATYIFDADKMAVSVSDSGKVDSVISGTFKKFLSYEYDNKETKETKEAFFDPSDDYRPLSEKPDTWEIKPGSEESYRCIFYKDIEKILNLNDLFKGDKTQSGLMTGARVSSDNRYRDHSFSDIKLMNIYDLAEKLYCGRKGDDSKKRFDFFENTSLATQLSYIQAVKNISGSLDSIGVFYTDEPKPLARRHYDDFTLSEKRFLTAKEADREYEERMEMCKGGIDQRYLDRLNEDPALLARDFRNRYNSSMNDDETVDLTSYIEIPASKVIEVLLKILDEECNLYNLPQKKIYEPDPESAERILKEIDHVEDLNTLKPASLIEYDLSGSMVREYKEESLVYEIVPEIEADGNTAFLLPVHIRDFYRTYELTDTDEGGDIPVFFYTFEEGGDRFRLEYTIETVYSEDVDDDLMIDRLMLYRSEPGDIKDEKGQKWIYMRDIDRTSYFFDKGPSGDKDISRIFLRHCPEGCLEIASWALSRLKKDNKH
ncbi:MAG: hypothetical protein K5886_04755 [Lachnospiraceae bacterium]|nr:hypothetical protein [Lachnospiraceae bacterium]